DRKRVGFNLRTIETETSVRPGRRYLNRERVGRHGGDIRQLHFLQTAGWGEVIVVNEPVHFAGVSTGSWRRRRAGPWRFTRFMHGDEGEHHHTHHDDHQRGEFDLRFRLFEHEEDQNGEAQ